MTNQSYYKRLILALLTTKDKPMTASQVAKELGTTQQRAAAALRSLYCEGAIIRKSDGNKYRYAVKDFKTMESFIEGYKWYDDYPFIVVHPHTLVHTVIADKGFRSYTLAVIYAEYLSIIRKEEIYIIDNR